MPEFTPNPEANPTLALHQLIEATISHRQVAAIDFVGGPYLSPSYRQQFLQELSYINWYNGHPRLAQAMRMVDDSAAQFKKSLQITSHTIKTFLRKKHGIEKLQEELGIQGEELITYLRSSLRHPDQDRFAFVLSRLYDLEMYAFISDHKTEDRDVELGIHPYHNRATNLYHDMEHANNIYPRLGRNRGFSPYATQVGYGMLVQFTRLSQASEKLVQQWDSAPQALPLIRAMAQPLTTLCLESIDLTLPGTNLYIARTIGTYTASILGRTGLVEIPIDKALANIQKFITLES